ncbi:hypothetical protein SLA2020_435800 [Shorea laevis]
MVEALVMSCAKPLGKIGLQLDPLIKCSDTQQGSSAQGNVECAIGLVPSALGECDVRDEGDGKMKPCFSCVGSGRLTF